MYEMRYMFQALPFRGSRMEKERACIHTQGKVHKVHDVYHQLPGRRDLLAGCAEDHGWVPIGSTMGAVEILKKSWKEGKRYDIISGLWKEAWLN